MSRLTVLALAAALTCGLTTGCNDTQPTTGTPLPPSKEFKTKTGSKLVLDEAPPPPTRSR
jgi:hypothetical protein